LSPYAIRSQHKVIPHSVGGMEINRNAPATAEGEIRINAEPHTVFSVIAGVNEWPSWNPDVRSAMLEGALEPGSVFRWRSGPSSLTSTLEVVDPPREIAWTGTTMRIKAVHVFRFEAMGGGTLARSEMSSPTSRPRRSVALAWRKRWGTGVEHVIADLAGES
jgi:hypothetical protein